MTIKEQYRKERKRILATKRRYEKKGLDVSLNIPAIPKNITSASVRRLQKITLEKIREKSQGPSYVTGEVLDYGKFIRQRKRALDQERKDLDTIKTYAERGVNLVYDWQAAIDSFESTVDQYPDRAREIVMQRIESYKEIYGARDLGYALKALIESGEVLTPKDAYNMPLIFNMLTKLSALLGLTKQEYEDIIEDIDRVSSYEEYYGEWSDWY